jgi:hypothetical protein
VKQWNTFNYFSHSLRKEKTISQILLSFLNELRIDQKRRQHSIYMYIYIYILIVSSFPQKMGFVILSCFYKWPTIYFFYILPWHNSLWYSIDIKLLDVFVYLTFLFIETRWWPYLSPRAMHRLHFLCLRMHVCVRMCVSARLYSWERAPVATLTQASHVQNTESHSSAGNCTWQPVCLTVHKSTAYSSIIWSHVCILNLGNPTDYWMHQQV